MKLKTVILFVSCMLCSISSFGQRQKETINFLAEFEWNFIGDYTYQFIRQENGENLKDGPFEMKAVVNQRNLDYKHYYTADITGKYSLTGSHLKGNLHGSLTLNANLNINATNGERANGVYTLKGNFNNGIPHGNFTVNYPTYGIKVNVNYKNGILVGGFFVTGLSESLPFTTKGTLTQNGKPTGVWEFETVHGKREMTFSNGVVVNRKDYDADLRAKAKLYASGAISKEKLMQENICVKIDSISLGRDAWCHILNSGIDFDKLGGYDFTSSEYVKYCYLDRLPFFSAEGLEKLKQQLTSEEELKGFDTGQDVNNDKMLYLEFYGGVIRFDQSTELYYCRLHKSNELSKYCVGYPDWSSYYENIYMTNEQVATLRKCMHEKRSSQIDKKNINELSRPSLENFLKCPYQEDVFVYTGSYYTYPGLIYFSRDKLEDYFIGKIELEKILEITPEARYEVVKAKYNKYKETYKIIVEQWFSNRVINIPYYNLDYSLQQALPTTSPIISYRADSVFVSKDNVVKAVYSSVNIGKKEKYKTYNFITYVSGGEENYTIRFSDFVLVENEFDMIKNMNKEIKAKEKELKVSSKDVYSSYSAYKSGQDFSLNYDNLKVSISQRKEHLLLIDQAFDFIEKRKDIYNTDNDVLSKSASIKDVNKAYSSYIQMRDLSWNPNFDFTLFYKYAEVQKKCIEFIELRQQVDNNNLKIKEKKSVAPYFYKLYDAYMKGFDLEWKPDGDFTNVKTLISIQEECLVLIEEEDIKEIDKKAKKQKIANVNDFLESNK